MGTGLRGVALGMGVPTGAAFGILGLVEESVDEPSALTRMALTGSRGGANPFGVCWAVTGRDGRMPRIAASTRRVRSEGRGKSVGAVFLAMVLTVFEDAF